MRNWKSIRLRAVGAVLVVAMFGAVTAQSASAQATTGNCPGTFEVLHNDRIGKLKLPKGPYIIRVKNMECEVAVEDFKRFLDDPKGNLPRGWKLIRKKSKFKNKRGGYSFRVKPARRGGKGRGNGGKGRGGKGRGNGGGSASTGTCPGTFEVLHNDRIGKLRLPKGPYVIRVKNLSCRSAANYFKRFLSDPDGDLPRGWKLIKNKSKFKHKRGGYSFTTRPA